MFQQLNKNTYKNPILVLFASLLILFSFYIVIGCMKSKRSQIPALAQHLLPQYWAFFTANPLLERYYFYDISNGIPQPIELRHNVPEMYFGLSRHNRVKLLLEAEKLVQQIETWHQTTDSIPITLIRNNTRIGFMQGVYLVKKVIPSKWENRHEAGNISFAKIKVQL
jgi:hypothetical protein